MARRSAGMRRRVITTDFLAATGRTSRRGHLPNESARRRKANHVTRPLRREIHEFLWDETLCRVYASGFHLPVRVWGAVGCPGLDQPRSGRNRDPRQPDPEPVVLLLRR